MPPRRAGPGVVIPRSAGIGSAGTPQQPRVQRRGADRPGDAMSLYLREHRPRLHEAGTPEVALWYDRRHARGQVGEHEDRQSGEVHLAGFEFDRIGQNGVLRQQEAVAADRRLRDTCASAGEGEEGFVGRIALGDRAERRKALETRPAGRAREPAGGHEGSSDSTQTPDSEPEEVCPGRAEEPVGAGDAAALLDVAAPGGGIEHGRHQAETEDRQERDVELDRHRLEDEYPVALAESRRVEECGGPRRAFREVGEGECARVPQPPPR